MEAAASSETVTFTYKTKTTSLNKHSLENLEK
jgi:hypothetical protein